MKQILSLGGSWSSLNAIPDSSWGPVMVLTLTLVCRGLLANAILLVFYASPLSTVAEVVSTKSSASLQVPLCIGNVVNSLLWLVYGYVRPVPEPCTASRQRLALHGSSRAVGQ